MSGHTWTKPGAGKDQAWIMLGSGLDQAWFKPRLRLNEKAQESKMLAMTTNKIELLREPDELLKDDTTGQDLKELFKEAWRPGGDQRD